MGRDDDDDVDDVDDDDDNYNSYYNVIRLTTNNYETMSGRKLFQTQECNTKGAFLLLNKDFVIDSG